MRDYKRIEEAQEFLRDFYKRLEESQKFLGTPPPLNKGLREIIDFLLLPPSFRSMSYKQPELRHDFFRIMLTPLPYAVFCDKLGELNPGEFVIIVADLLRKLGGDVVMGRKGRDGAIDILWRTPEGDYIVQCKRWKNKIGEPKNKVGEPIVREVYGAAKKYKENENEKFIVKGAFVVTSSEFTDNAIGFIADLSLRVGLIDGKELFNLMSLQMPTVVDAIREGRWKSHR